jgi:hypothetical protein
VLLRASTAQLVKYLSELGIIRKKTPYRKTRNKYYVGHTFSVSPVIFEIKPGTVINVILYARFVTHS